MWPRTTCLFARAATCAPKHQKPTTKNRTCTAGFKPVIKTRVYISTPPATAPFHVGSSWLEQKMGFFGSFLYMNIFPRRFFFRLPLLCSLLFTVWQCGMWLCAGGRPALLASSRAACRAQGLRGVGLGPIGRGCARKTTGAARFAMFWFSAPHYRGGGKRK